MIKQKTVTVGEHEYLLTQFPATRGLQYQKALAKIILPALGEIFSENEEQAVFKALSKISENIDQLDEKMLKSMVTEGATKGNISINFDQEFAGNYGDLFSLVKEIVLFNFESVFTVFGSDVQIG